MGCFAGPLSIPEYKSRMEATMDWEISPLCRFKPGKIYFRVFRIRCDSNIIMYKILGGNSANHRNDESNWVSWIFHDNFIFRFSWIPTG